MIWNWNRDSEIDVAATRPAIDRLAIERWERSTIVTWLGGRSGLVPNDLVLNDLVLEDELEPSDRQPEVPTEESRTARRGQQIWRRVRSRAQSRIFFGTCLISAVSGVLLAFCCIVLVG